MAYSTPEYHPAFEEYCETIYELAEDDFDVIQARIADRLEISRPAVSEMIRKMEKEGLVSTEGTGISLTSEGQDLAVSVVLLGLSWTDAHHEAGKWEHVISPLVESALDKLLGEPTTCPHGNPIPGSSYEAPDSRHLVEVGVGEAFTVSRITEELEFTEGMLDFLEQSALIPGNRGTVTAASPDGTVTVEIAGNHLGVGVFAAERILVTAG